MVNVYHRKFRSEGCSKQPSFAVAGTEAVKYCAQRAPEGMVDVNSRKCRTEGCGKRSSFGVAGTKLGSTVHSTHWGGWSTSRAKSAEPEAAASYRLSELQVQERCSTMESMH